jgi:hypothetical protein
MCKDADDDEADSDADEGSVVMHTTSSMIPKHQMYSGSGTFPSIPSCDSVCDGKFFEGGTGKQPMTGISRVEENNLGGENAGVDNIDAEDAEDAEEAETVKEDAGMDTRCLRAGLMCA